MLRKIYKFYIECHGFTLNILEHWNMYISSLIKLKWNIICLLLYFLMECSFHMFQQQQCSERYSCIKKLQNYNLILSYNTTTFHTTL